MNFKRKWIISVHLVIFVTVLFFERATSEGSKCTTPGWFGSGCKYKCHCANNNCDNEGQCTDSSTCETGWFGPACQYVDLVWKNSTHQTPKWLADSNDTTCNPDQYSQSVTIYFENVFYFTWLRLYFSKSDITHSSTFHVKTSINGTDSSCSNQYSLPVNDIIMDIHCDPGLSFQELILSGNGLDTLCSLYVSGGHNVALNENTTQSSTFDLSSWTPKAGLAVDGNTNPDYNKQSCSHTKNNSKPENWTLTFQQTRQVSRYVIYNRMDTTCDTGKYGRECEKTCHCATSDNKCFVSTGGCPSGCPVGYQGEDCGQLCSSTHYGQHCSMRCSPNCSEQFCDAFNGKCYSCIIGRQGFYCDTDCNPGYYDENCNKTCSDMCKDQLCHPKSGNCISCNAGSTGKLCDAACTNSYFGENCARRCSSNCLDQICNSTDGVCHSCIAGTSGPNCEPVPEVDVLPVAAIIGAVVGIVVMAILIVIGVIIWRRYKGKNPDYRSENNMDSVSEVMHENTELTLKSGENEPPNYIPPKQTLSVTDKHNFGSTNNNKQQPTAAGAYYNIGLELTDTSISAGDLNKFMTSHTKEYFQKQFTNIPANTSATTIVGLRPENQYKNRYKNISAYDHSRVHLQADSGKKDEDYINASYINGYKKQKKYIASQGPTKTILEDFVRMLWEQGVEVVVMLTNLIEEGKLKCEQYWPNDDEMVTGEITIKLTTTQVFADYTIRRLQLFKGTDSGQILTHFHFTTWPDKDVPTTAWGLVELEQKLDQISTDKPIVVHCSAGVGRTGTFIALHNILEEIEETGHMDFFTTVQKLRNDRINMVQTSKQYEFLHKAAQIALVCMDTTVTSNNIQDRIQTLEGMSTCGQFNIEKEFKSVCLVCDEDDYVGNDGEEQVENVYYNSRALSNKMKNRLNNVLPKDYYRPNLACEIHGMETYINAVFIPSFKRHNRQFLTQLPLPTTITDFWRLVTQYNVRLVVAFERELMAQDTTIGDYLTERDDDNKTTSFFNIKIQSVESGPNWDVQRLVVTIDSQQKSRMTKVAFDGEYCLSHIACRSTDFEPESLLELVIKIRSMIPVGDRRILYMCRNGAKFSGLVCTMSLLLDRMDNDQHVSVPLVLGSVKAIRPQVVATLDQYRLLYQALNLYTETNNDYSNFGSS